MIEISVIVPHRDSIQYLPKLFSSIPEDKRIEIIIVDNSIKPITRDLIPIERNFTLLFSDPNRFAGGARNIGVDEAKGEWLLFLDADDYFAEGAFDVFLSKLSSEADIIYTCMGGIYLDSGRPSDRGAYYTKLVKSYINGEISENDLRLGFPSPCCKMIRRDFIVKNKIKFDEIVAGNDIYFSLVSGYYARKIEAVDFITYIATVSKGSLTKRRDYAVIEARLYSKLHCNEFLKKHHLNGRQQSVLFPFFDGKHLGIKAHLKFVYMILKFRQNPFIGISRWAETFFYSRKIDRRDSAYIVK